MKKSTAPPPSTASQLADALQPIVYRLVDERKADFMEGLPLFKRVTLGAIWPLILSSLLPLLVEWLIGLIADKLFAARTAKGVIGMDNAGAVLDALKDEPTPEMVWAVGAARELEAELSSS